MNAIYSPRLSGRSARRAAGIFIVGLAAAGASACAPVFSELQGARLVGPGHVEVTPSVSAVYSSDRGTTDHLQDHYGLQVATGVHEKVDLRVRYENIRLVGDDDSVNVLGLGPKLALKTDRLALYLPAGFAFGGGVKTRRSWMFHPALLFTQPFGDNVDVDASAKYLIYLHHDAPDNLVAFNLGLGLGPRSRRWVIRPEVGFLFDPGESGHATHASLGVSFRP